MVTGSVRADTLLRRLHGTAPFAAYCKRRGIIWRRSGHFNPGKPGKRDIARWQAAVQRLPESKQKTIQLDFFKLSDLNHGDGDLAMVEAAKKRVPPASVPRGAPLLLWYLVHHPDFFETFFFNHRIRETDCWKVAQAPPGLKPGRRESCRIRLEAALKGFLRQEGTEGFCSVDVHVVNGGYCYNASIGNRIHLQDEFTNTGQPTVRPVRLASEMLFVYHPADGMLYLKTRQRKPEKNLELFQRFARAVFGVELGRNCLRDVFNLDVLKQGRPLLADAPDMAWARVKAIGFAYTDAQGGGRVRFETGANSPLDAVPKLLRTHMKKPEGPKRLRVIRAELQIRMNVRGKEKNYFITLHHNSCSLDQTALSGRFRRCLKRWGLCHAPRS